MRKSTHPLMQLLIMSLIALVLMGVAVVATSIISIAGGLDPTASDNFWWMQSLTQLLTLLVPVILMVAIYYRGEQRSFLRLDFGARQWLNGLIGAVILGLLVPLIDWTTTLNDSWHWHGAWAAAEEKLRAMGETSSNLLNGVLSDTRPLALVANILAVALVPAVCEELFFRGGVQNLLQRWWRNPHWAIWVTAVIFSLVHGEFFAFLPRLLMGALLGYLYVRSGSLLTNAIVHFVNNLVLVIYYYLTHQGILYGDPEAPLSLAWPVVVACTIAAAGLYYIYFFNKRHASGIKC